MANVIFIQGEQSAIQTINKTIIDSTIASIFPDSQFNTVPETLDAFVNDYETFKADFPESNQAWELRVETEIVFESKTVITYSINSYTFTGGAHGNDRIQLLNFDPITGRILMNSELFSDPESFKNIARDAFLTSQNSSNQNFNMEDYFFGEEFTIPENMGYSETGFILLYNVYEIATYDQGYTEIAIPYDHLERVLSLAPY